jgi:micrococcal nuclease
MFLDLASNLGLARAVLLGVAVVASLATAPLEHAAGPSFPQDAADAPLALDAGRRERLTGPFEAQLVRVVDSDTFVARIRIWFGQEATVSVQLRGVDAPELTGRCPGESRKAEAARERLALYLTSGALALRDASYDKYGGRIVASATVSDPFAGAEDVGQLMLASGHARSYDGRARTSWCVAPDWTAQSPESFPSLSAQR